MGKITFTDEQREIAIIALGEAFRALVPPPVAFRAPDAVLDVILQICTGDIDGPTFLKNSLSTKVAQLDQELTTVQPLADARIAGLGEIKSVTADAISAVDMGVVVEPAPLEPPVILTP